MPLPLILPIVVAVDVLRRVSVDACAVDLDRVADVEESVVVVADVQGPGTRSSGRRCATPPPSSADGAVPTTPHQDGAVRPAVLATPLRGGRP